MKKTLFLILAVVVATVVQAQDKVGAYYNNYFDKEYSVDAGFDSKGVLSVFFNVEGNSVNDEVDVNISGENISFFITSLQNAKQKYLEWISVAKANNVTKMSKDMDVSFPRVTIAWYGAKWWFAFRHKLQPRFMITESGKYLCVISDTVTASSNEYIDQKYYLVFQNEEDFDSLINAINPTVILEKLNNKQNVEDLFQ